jgi:predicted RNA-binding protein with PUA-like domain
VIFQTLQCDIARTARESHPDETGRDAAVEYFQALVDGGFATWRMNEAGATELHLANGNVFLLGSHGVKRLR